MTREERHDSMTELAKRLIGSVAAVADEDAERWGRSEPEGWAIIDGPEREFLLSCATWEQSGERIHLHEVADAFDSVVEAWREASVAYRQQEAHR